MERVKPLAAFHKILDVDHEFHKPPYPCPILGQLDDSHFQHHENHGLSAPLVLASPFQRRLPSRIFQLGQQVGLRDFQNSQDPVQPPGYFAELSV